MFEWPATSTTCPIHLMTRPAKTCSLLNFKTVRNLLLKSKLTAKSVKMICPAVLPTFLPPPHACTSPRSTTLSCKSSKHPLQPLLHQERPLKNQIHPDPPNRITELQRLHQLTSVPTATVESLANCLNSVNVAAKEISWNIPAVCHEALPKLWMSGPQDCHVLMSSELDQIHSGLCHPA